MLGSKTPAAGRRLRPPFARAGRSAAALVASSLLAGCVITTYRDPDPPPPPPPQDHAARPAKARPPKAQKPKPAKQRPAPAKQAQKGTRPGGPFGSQTPRKEQPGPTDLAPRITSPIAFGNGKSGAFVGHAFVIPENTTKLPNLTTLVPFATLFTDRFEVQPQEFSGGFPGALVQEEWFAIRYVGRFEVPTEGTWTFKLLSDDGAVLWIDGQKVVDNDGQHGPKAVTGDAKLTAGPHSLRLEYFQAKKGSVALVLSIVDKGQEQPLVGVR